MALSEKSTTARPALSLPTENQSAPTLTSRQRRLLRRLQQGDLIWERADDPGHLTVYDEKRGCDQNLPTATVTALEQQGWIRRRPNTQADRLDSWELTPQGQALVRSEE
jgi:DNA-binding MarR family transcriptional regulator